MALQSQCRHAPSPGPVPRWRAAEARSYGPTSHLSLIIAGDIGGTSQNDDYSWEALGW